MDGRLKMSARDKHILMQRHTHQTQLLLRPLQRFRPACGKTVWVSVGPTNRPCSLSASNKCNHAADISALFQGTVCLRGKHERKFVSFFMQRSTTSGFVCFYFGKTTEEEPGFLGHHQCHDTVRQTPTQIVLEI